jgi:hypothetical protein
MPSLGAPELLVIVAVVGLLCGLPLAGAIALVVMLIRDRRRGGSDR